MSQTNENQNMPGPNRTTQQMVRVGMPATAPYLTYTLIVVTVIFYILQVVILAMTGNDILTLYGARINACRRSNPSPSRPSASSAARSSSPV